MKLRLSLIVAVLVFFFSLEGVVAQQHPLSCQPQAISKTVLESNICADKACFSYLKTVRDTLAKIRDENGKPVKSDIDFLQVAKILRDISFSEYFYHKTIESYIDSYLSSAKENQQLVERIEGHIKNPEAQSVQDQADLQKAQKRMTELLAIKPITLEIQKEISLLDSEITAIQKIPKTLDSQKRLLPVFKERAAASLAFVAMLEKQTLLSKNVDLSNQEESFIRNLYIIYKHRLDMLKGRPMYRDCNLRDAEIYAIFHYTGTGAYFINRHLHKNNGAPSMQQWADLIQQGLSKIADYQKLVVRGGTLSSEQLQVFKKGHEFVFPAFMSASTSIPFSKAYRFTIQSKMGKYVAPLSMSPAEEEVLFGFNSRFRILDVKGNHYFLEELN